MFRNLALSLFSLAILTLAGTAGACSKPKYSSTYHKQVPTKNINQTLFSEALRLEANYARCRAKRKEMTAAKPLTTITAAHSKWMARSQKLSHTSTLPGKARMANRVRSTRLKFKTAAENIAAFDRFAFPKGAFRIRNASACKFATQAGKAIPAHSYASLAKTVVDGWMKSRGHKKNLLNRQMRQTGAGIAFDRKAPFCGRFYITQVYLG